jgi:hypothetical protein
MLLFEDLRAARRSKHVPRSRSATPRSCRTSSSSASRGSTLTAMLRFEHCNLAPESRLARKMSDLMRVEEALRLRCRMHMHLCGLQHCRFFSSELCAAL